MYGFASSNIHIDGFIFIWKLNTSVPVLPDSIDKEVWSVAYTLRYSSSISPHRLFLLFYPSDLSSFSRIVSYIVYIEVKLKMCTI